MWLQRGFFSGMLLGSAAGLIMAAMFNNDMGSTRKMGRRTGRMMSSMARDVRDFMQR